MSSPRKTFAERLKEARTSAGLSQTAAAGKVPTSAASLAAYEQGARDVPDAVLERLAELYGVHVAVLRYGESVVQEAGLSEVRRVVLKAAADLVAMAGLIGDGTPTHTLAPFEPVRPSSSADQAQRHRR